MYFLSLQAELLTVNEDLEEQGNAYRGRLQVLFTCFSVRYPVSGRDDNRSILQSIYPGMAGKKSVIKN